MYGHDVANTRTQPDEHALGPVDVDVAEQDALALRGQPLGDRPSDALRRAGDEGNPLSEAGHDSPKNSGRPSRASIRR